MKFIILSFVMACCFTVANAQSTPGIKTVQTDSLQEYTGKYRFPDGSPVTEIGVIVENGILTATSPMGNSELKKTDTKDVYEIVAYGGTATFKRTPEGKITTLLIQVQDVTMEGTRSEGIVMIRQWTY